MEDLKERLFPSKPTSNITPRDPSHKPSSNPYGRQPFQGVISAANISKKMKVKFSKAWMSFLRLPLSIDVYKKVLVTLHQAVIPYLSNPILLGDFLTKSYDIGGVISVMALSSLFILMTEHGLEYPNLYGKLYALLQPSIFIAKHRAKFFQETKMAAINLAIFFFTLSALLGAYHARQLHDGSVYKFFDRRPPVKTAEVIQMVTGEEEPQSPPMPPPSSSQGDTNYGPHNPNAPPYQGKTDVAGENLEGRPSPRRPPSQGEDYLNAQPSPKPGKSGGEGAYSRDNPSTPPSPDQNDPHNQGMLFKSFCANGGRLCMDSTSNFGGLRNRMTLRAPAFTSGVQIRQDEDQLLSIISHWVLSYTTRIFNNWY